MKGIFGLWYEHPRTNEPLVVEPLEQFGDNKFGIVGLTFVSFLAARSAFYLSVYLAEGKEVEDSLNALDVPVEMRRATLEYEDDYLPFHQWANPDLPPDPYARGLSPDEINAIARDLNASG
jgi:hypothetical protein